MQTDNTRHLVLPMIDPVRERSGFQVARILADAFGASLRVAMAGATTPAAQDLARQLSVPAEQLDDVVIENTAGNLADATIRIADTLQQTMVILAVRFRDEATPNDAQTLDAIAQQILEKITGSVLVVAPDRDMSNWHLRKELLPQDGTPNCATALAQFIDRSVQMGIENLVLRVAGVRVGQPAEPGSLPTPRYVDHPQYEWETWGREFLDRVTGMGTNPGASRLRLLMASGDPATEILRVAREESVDLIVLPWHCAFGSGRARMVKAVLRDTSCPVLLLPEACGDQDQRPDPG
jgi:nucleotide-binding universal stress UspA family protein